ncbi:IPT/TIG domain-containing protein [Rufibacter psychrotolerans]|uniref:IPT/TIG domain-containing protein n=1 Tax=Rufibacter psychrotolerans TaxID=2812556 RepID=UPI0019675BAF|nr:IPT/TIG domain-containing protein [Rufibacter sp. SYSU D00308]
MKNLYKIRLALLALLVFSIGFLSSCGDDDENSPNGGQVELLSFGPTGAKHGEEIRFIGHNLNKVESIQFQGATVAKAQFIEHTSELIRLTVPEEAMEGMVTLKVSGGDDVVSKTVLSFNVPITITNVTAEARPGATITITGTKLTWVDSVGFGNETVKQFINQTPTQIQLQVPANAKTGKLIIYGGGEDPTFLETENELIVTLPTVTSLSPAAIRHDEVLTINGANLDLVGQVRFPGGSNVVTFESQSATAITLKVPTNATNGALTLVTKGSMVEVKPTQTITVTLPVISGITTVRHNQNTTITGTDLDKIKELTFPGDFRVARANFVSQSETQIVVAVPAMAGPGALGYKTMHDFTVASAGNFNVLLPSVSSYSPAVVAPNGTLTINGTNLDLIQDITFGGMTTKVATFLNQNATRLQVTVPTTAKTGALKFTLASGYVVEAPEVSVVMPTVSSITPTPVAPGSYLTINGSNLNLVKSVKFTGNSVVTNFLTQSENQIILMVPTGARTGKLILVTHTNTEIETTQEATVGAAAPTISEYIYDDALASGWAKWNGYNGVDVQDLDNATNVKRGSKSFKITFSGASGTIQLKPNSPNFANGFTHIVLYVKGTANTRAAIQFKLGNGSFTGEQAFDLVEGEYTVVQIPLSNFGNISSGVDEFLIKNQGTIPNTFYIDDLGLR